MKTIQISSCKECPYRIPDAHIKKSYCLINNYKEVSERIKTFPKTCPLEDSK